MRRIQPFLSLVDREVEFLRTWVFIVLHLLGIYFIYLFSVENKKNPRYRDSNSRPNASEGYEPNEGRVTDLGEKSGMPDTEFLYGGCVSKQSELTRRGVLFLLV